MPARDVYHSVVKLALIQDGWTVTHDPYRLSWGDKDLYVDLAAERLLAAEREGRQIAVEVKSFLGASEVYDLEQSLGQYTLYHDILARTDPERVLYLAITAEVEHRLFNEPVGQLLLENERLRLLVFDPEREMIVRWIPSI